MRSYNLTQGSSPLARGLLRTHGHVGGGDGIIPARAGFTALEREDEPLEGDHPRSRGVYTDRNSSAPRESGSSPLARGLPLRFRSARASGGIIPARAGFTTRPVRFGRCSADHPRSRGVYALMNSLPGSGFGSSPLARGLPSAAGRSARPAADHPRSRGVYGYGPIRGTVDLGSSPLARGLPSRHGVLKHNGRIIPARAGFTRAPRRPCGPQKDHPRSRGVYSGAHAKTDG